MNGAGLSRVVTSSAIVVDVSGPEGGRVYEVADGADDVDIDYTVSRLMHARMHARTDALRQWMDGRTGRRADGCHLVFTKWQPRIIQFIDGTMFVGNVAVNGM